MKLALKTIWLFAFTLICLGMSFPTSAQDAGGWKLRNMNYTTTGLGVKYEYRDRPTTIEILYSSSDKAGDVGFVCASGQLLLRVTIVPGDIYEVIGDNINNAYEFNGNSRRTFRPTMTINDEKAPKLKWFEGREDRVIMPLAYKSSALIYNSAVKGESVNLKRKKKFDLALNLPPPNEDFKSFGGECGIGKNK